MAVGRLWRILPFLIQLLGSQIGFKLKAASLLLVCAPRRWQRSLMTSFVQHFGPCPFPCDPDSRALDKFTSHNPPKKQQRLTTNCKDCCFLQSILNDAFPWRQRL